MIKVGAVSLGWSGTALPQVFEQLKAMGGECVEINSQTERHHGLTLDSRTIPQVRAWAADAGLTIGSLSGYSDFAQRDADALAAERERLLTTCRVAAEMEVEIVRAFVGDTKPGLTLDEVYPAIVDSFRQVAAEAQKLGLKLAIENHGRLLNDGPGLVQLIKEVNASNLGLTLDTGNFAWAGHDAAQTQHDFEVALPYTFNLHIKDGVWREDRFDFVPAGEGELDIAGLMKQLVQRDYQGMVYSEYEGSGDFLTNTEQSIKNLQAAYQAGEQKGMGVA